MIPVSVPSCWHWEALPRVLPQSCTRVEAILDSAIADGYCQMGFAAAGLTVKNQRAPFGDEIWPQVGTEQGLTQCRLQTEVKLINRLEKGEVGLAGKTLQARLRAMRHFFGQQKGKKITIAPVFFLGSIRRIPVVFTPLIELDRRS